MKINKVLVILLISILLFSSVSPLAADDDRSYTIDDAIINLTQSAPCELKIGIFQAGIHELRMLKHRFFQYL